MTSVRKIQRIFSSSTISNRDLLAQCQQEDMETIITRRQWRWIGHVLHKDVNSITKVAIYWTPEGKQKRGWSKTTRWRTVEAELKNMKHSWGTIQRLAMTNRGGGASLLPCTLACMTVVMNECQLPVAWHSHCHGIKPAVTPDKSSSPTIPLLFSQPLHKSVTPNGHPSNNGC